jgi:hypothetical protein
MTTKKISKPVVKKTVAKKAAAPKAVGKKLVMKKAEANKTVAKKVAKKKIIAKETTAQEKKATAKKTVFENNAAQKPELKRISVKKKAVKIGAVASRSEPAAAGPKPQVREVIIESEPRPPVPQPSLKPYFSPPVYWQDRYKDDRIVLMIRDPYWCFVYWDLSGDKEKKIGNEIQNSAGTCKLVLRIYDVTNIEFNGSNAHQHKDIEVSGMAGSWYVNVWTADRSYCVDIGLLYAGGNFVTLLRSNVVTTPRDTVSSVIDEEWMVVDETFDQLCRTAGAGELGRSSEAITKYMLARERAEVSSGGLASMGSNGGRPQPVRKEDFWLVVNTELIVYGATEPDAKVIIQGEPLRLNHDGTFSVRYALPKGRQTIEVKAVNAAGTQEREITPVIEKQN